jgi:hypothetical protein
MPGSENWFGPSKRSHNRHEIRIELTTNSPPIVGVPRLCA